MSLGEGISLWKEYNLRVLQLLEHYQLPFVIVRYEELIENPQSVQTMLEHALGLNLQEAWRFIDKRLNRSSSLEMHVPSEIQELYDTLLDSSHKSVGWSLPYESNCAGRL